MRTALAPLHSTRLAPRAFLWVLHFSSLPSPQKTTSSDSKFDQDRRSAKADVISSPNIVMHKPY